MTGSAPASLTARAASRSLSDPGKVMTPIRTQAAYRAGRTGWAYWLGVLAGRTGWAGTGCGLASRLELAQRGVGGPAYVLTHGHHRPAPRLAVERDVVDESAHDRQAAPGLGDVGDPGLRLGSRCGRFSPGLDPRPARVGGPADALVRHL